MTYLSLTVNLIVAATLTGVRFTFMLAKDI